MEAGERTRSVPAKRRVILFRDRLGRGAISLPASEPLSVKLLVLIPWAVRGLVLALVPLTTVLVAFAGS
jgi:hypothetical protein